MEPLQRSFFSDSSGSRRAKRHKYLDDYGLSLEKSLLNLSTIPRRKYSSYSDDSQFIPSAIDPLFASMSSLNSTIPFSSKHRGGLPPGSKTMLKQVNLRGGFVARDFMAKMSYNMHSAVGIRKIDVDKPASPSVASALDRYFAPNILRNTNGEQYLMFEKAKAATQINKVSTAYTAANANTMLAALGLASNFGSLASVANSTEARFSYRGGRDSYEYYNPSSNSSVTLEIYVITPRKKGLSVAVNEPMVDNQANQDAIDYWTRCYDTLTKDQQLLTTTTSEFGASSNYTKFDSEYVRVGQDPTRFKQFNKHYIVYKRAIKLHPGCTCVLNINIGARTIMMKDCGGGLLLPGFMYQIAVASRGERCYETTASATDPKMGFSAHDYICKRDMYYKVGFMFCSVPKTIGTLREAETATLITGFTTAGTLVDSSDVVNDTADADL